MQISRERGVAFHFSDAWVSLLSKKCIGYLLDLLNVRPVFVEFHEEFHCVKYADMAKRENVKVSWDVRRVSSP
jgi:hypothetical protein